MRVIILCSLLPMLLTVPATFEVKLPPNRMYETVDTLPADGYMGNAGPVPQPAMEAARQKIQLHPDLLLKDTRPADVLRGKIVTLAVTQQPDTNDIESDRHFQAGPQPVLVIDGMIRPLGTLRTMDTSEIKSIEIYKDKDLHGFHNEYLGVLVLHTKGAPAQPQPGAFPRIGGPDDVTEEQRKHFGLIVNEIKYGGETGFNVCTHLDPHRITHLLVFKDTASIRLMYPDTTIHGVIKIDMQ